ncbi:hypothetical protein SPRG_05260 [Saprolegnia parasitica CBS 223.65]|uniref:DUF4042 domain-containing protein n=1 Tax=Saprolegnia parasitica (strain CBS 223.65) TaxID=695850 RepID=A0A067CH49_SAPPC|nr:hypothetical protein SPRG_05260 [Saprolegnia parasitica CBS 223.65]KDO30069.1 hypothetical protein SPRG_05260 [Saprolegnia parasitica CBS 223.65]|eukprot:XP_012199250.1 hypothetical protein SPRG_05260 [Saprolegnia parasitica CBS 223.65]
MNSYLQLKCRSEQQVLNDLTKCVAAKDYTSKRTAALLHELTFFHVSVVADADGSSAYVHDSVLRDLSTLLVNIKDKKEDQKLVRIVHVLLQHIAQQIQFAQRLAATDASASSIARSTPRGDNTGAILVQLASLLDVVAKNEINHPFPPRRVSAYKLYTVLCATLHQPERCYSLVSGIASSSAWTMLKLTSAKKKTDKDLPTQVALLDASLQVARSLRQTAPQILDPLLPQLIAGAFLPSRHAAATCLALFETKPLQVVDALMAHVGSASVSINTPDAITTCYLLKLCGKIARLPVGNREASAAAASLLDMNFDAPREPKAASGLAIEQHISTRVTDLLLDVCMQKHTFVLSSAPTGSGPPTLAPCSVLLTAIEEMTRGQVAPKCFEKVRGGLSPFEIAASGIQLVLTTHGTSPLVLHRVCRAVTAVASSFDLALISFSAHHLDFFSKITEAIWAIADAITTYAPCVLKESLVALVWLLPRRAPPRTASQAHLAATSTSWPELLPQLLALPPTAVSHLDREAIVRALLARATLVDVDPTLLGYAASVLQHWYETSPRHWHGDVFQSLWETYVSSDTCFRPSVFESPLAVLDFHQSHGEEDRATQAMQYTKCIAIHFLTSTPVLLDPSCAAMCSGVILRLAKLATLDDWPVRRSAVAGLLRLHTVPRVPPVLASLRRHAPTHGYADLLVTA